MRSTMTTGVLEPLSDTNLTLADSTEDIRGLRVFDRNGSEFGKIDEVFIDPAERRARFVTVKSGDILGLGGQRYLVPVELLTFGGDHVQVNDTAERITQGPQWDGQDLTTTDVGDATTNGADAPLVINVYEYYAVREPFWSPDYQQPTWKR